jgi:mRNA-degrading endonuclease RelE of RelBE toxin-antitoxin system
MLIDHKPDFLKRISKIRDNLVKDKIRKLIEKIIENPEIGKPMKYSRKGTREVYIPPFRLAYAYIPSEQKILFLKIYHKDEQ